MKGCVATLGAAGVEVAQQVLAETHVAILPLVPYLDALRRAFIADTICARLDDWKRRRRGSTRSPDRHRRAPR